MSAPTATSGLLLAFCMFLPVGLYGGCGNAPPRAVYPVERQLEAIKSGDLAELLFISAPYVLAFVIGMGTLSVCWLDEPRSSSARWICYTVLISAICVGTIGQVLAEERNSPDRNLSDRWHDQGLVLLSLFWLLNVVLATWLEAHTMFLAAMTLQGVLIVLIWLGLLRWLVFLEGLLVGGWLTAVCALMLPITTVLQIFADASAARESLRVSRVPTLLDTSKVLPQFTLRGMLVATAVCSTGLGITQTFGLEAAFICGYAATFAGLALRRIGSITGTEGPADLLILAWYGVAAILLGVGGLLAQ